MRQLIRQEVAGILPGILEQLASKGLLAPQQPQHVVSHPVEQVSQGTGAATALKAILLDKDLWDVGAKLFMTFAQYKAMNSNPIMQLQQIQAQYPQLLAMFSPNPWGPGFQSLMTNSAVFGANFMQRAMLQTLAPLLKGDGAKKGLEEIQRELVTAPPNAWPGASPGIPGGFPGSSPAPNSPPIGAPQGNEITMGLQGLDDQQFTGLLREITLEFHRRKGEEKVSV